MKLLDRYIGSNVLKSCLIVMLALVSMFALLDLVDQMDDIGKGRYRLKDALWFVFLKLPGLAIDLLPVSTLLGALIGLGGLAAGSELVAMRAAGISASRIGWAAVKAGAVLIFIAAMAAEFVAPPLEQTAQTRRWQAMSENNVLRTRNGFWARNETSFINVRNFINGDIPADIDIYEFDTGGNLRVFTHAARADILNRDEWLLHDVVQQTITGPQILSRSLPQMSWQPFLKGPQIQMLVLAPESLAPSELYENMRDLKRRGQKADRYEFVLWSKLSMPLATIAMLLLVMPSVFGPLRSSSTARRIILGTAIGLAFYLVNRVVGHLGLLLRLNAAVTALTPATLLMLVAVAMLRKVR